MKRIMLKLSGEALAGSKKTGFDEETVRKVALQVKQLVDDGIQVGIVIGGGNFWRGRTSENIDRTKADQIGMLATIMNCIYVSEIFRSVGMQTNVLTPFECGSFTKLFSKDRANKYFELRSNRRNFERGEFIMKTKKTEATTPCFFCFTIQYCVFMLFIIEIKN